jgi:hypothetical protein
MTCGLRNRRSSQYANAFSKLIRCLFKEVPLAVRLATIEQNVMVIQR